jgi:hypothetical protein
MAYTTLAALKTRLRLEDAADDANLQAAIDAAEQIIDGWCRRTFGQTGPSARRFTAQDPTIVVIDDAVSVTQVKVDRDGDGTFEETLTGWDLWPYDAASVGRPYTQVRLLAGTFPAGNGAVQVTGTWGWPTVPSAVKLATEIQAAVLWRQGTQAPWGVADESLMGTDVTTRSRFLDRQAVLLLAPYRRVVFG